MAGLGSQPFGSSPYGVGTPATAPAPGGAILRDADGLPQGSRYIDPVTRDYVIDADGRFVGVENVRHLVQMALRTARESSAVRQLGLDTRGMDVVADDLERRLLNAYTAAVSHLVEAGLIAVVGLQGFRAGVRDGLAAGRAHLRFVWRDLGTSQTYEETV